MIDFSQNRSHLAYAERVLGVSFSHTPATWLTSLDQQGNILGVAVFSRFTTGNCEITVASSSPRFISKSFALAVAAYPFLQLACRRVTAIIAEDNIRSLKLAQRLGFQVEGTLRDWFPGGNAKILGLLRQDCEWLKDFDGLSDRTPST